MRDDWGDVNYDFTASSDDEARETALEFLEKCNEDDRKSIEEGEKSWQDYCRYEPLRLETSSGARVPLHGDTTSRLESGSPIELTELVNLSN